MTVVRKKVTVYLDPKLLRAVKARAASTGRREYEIVEDALHQYLGHPNASASRLELGGLLDQLSERSDLGDKEALDLAYAELHASRGERS